ncbi:MAG TPA: cytochrome C oxidase subunit IV family protein [Terriglobales bacterium]|nr:cytochrome C oxidase subunit IV family protein [Terriglobales bacterium]
MTHPAGDVVTAGHLHQGKGQFYGVWGGLLILTVVEIALAYNQVFTPRNMLIVLLILSIIKSALIIGYFMHLKFEAGRMKWLLMCSVCFCLALMAVFFADAERIVSLGWKAH